MPFNRYENVSTANPMPVQEVAGTYNAKEPISESNPLPVMEVEGGSYTNYETVSSSNPQPVAIIADSGTFTRYEDYSDTNAFPVKFIVGQTYDPRFDVSETNPWPVVVISGGAPAYEGPLDLVSAGIVAAFGQRAMSAAMLGQPYATLRRASDDAELEFAFDAEDGSAPVSDITTWAGGDVSFKTLNDGSGNANHATQATTSKQPAFAAAQFGSSPAAVFDSAFQQFLLTPSVSFADGTFTIFIVIELGEQDNKISGIDDHSRELDFFSVGSFGGGPGAHIIYVESTSDAYATAYKYIETDVTPISAGAHILEIVCGSGTSLVLVDGVALSLSSDDAAGTVGAIAGQLALGSISFAEISGWLAGKIAEYLAYASVKSSGDRLALRQNIATYYGITLP